MKRLLSRLWLLIGFAIINALGAIRFILELIGYATVPDDAKEAHGLLQVLANTVLALPWWAIWWPLFISYICAAGVAFDFSFDLFKRPKRTKGKAGKYLDRIQSYYISVKPYRFNTGSISSSGKSAVLAEMKMLISYLNKEGFNGITDFLDIEDSDLLENINDFDSIFTQDLRKITAYLKRGELQKAKEL